MNANRSNRAAKLIKRGWGTKDIAFLCHASAGEIEQLRRKLATDVKVDVASKVEVEIIPKAAVEVERREPKPEADDLFFEKPPPRVVERPREAIEKAAEKPKQSKSYDPFARTIWE